MTAPEPIANYLSRRAAEVNEWLDRLVPSKATPPEQLHRAMRYSLLAGGKRLRPVLVLAAGETFGADTDDLMPAACAIAVQMDPLAIFGGFGELLNTLLCDFEPIGGCDFAAYEVF